MSDAAPRRSVRLGSRRIDDGWVVVAALSVTETWGIVYYGFPVFLRAMEQDVLAALPVLLAGGERKRVRRS